MASRPPDFLVYSTVGKVYIIDGLDTSKSIHEI